MSFINNIQIRKGDLIINDNDEYLFVYHIDPLESIPRKVTMKNVTKKEFEEFHYNGLCYSIQKKFYRHHPGNPIK